MFAWCIDVIRIWYYVCTCFGPTMMRAHSKGQMHAKLARSRSLFVQQAKSLSHFCIICFPLSIINHSVLFFFKNKGNKSKYPNRQQRTRLKQTMALHKLSLALFALIIILGQTAESKSFNCARAKRKRGCERRKFAVNGCAWCDGLCLHHSECDAVLPACETRKARTRKQKIICKAQGCDVVGKMRHP